MKDDSAGFANKLKDSLYWWLGFRRPFIINDQYKLELLFIDREHQSVKVRITNLKTQEQNLMEYTTLL